MKTPHKKSRPPRQDEDDSRSHLFPMEADFLHEEETHFIVMSSAHFRAEIQAITAALPPAPPLQPLLEPRTERATQAAVTAAVQLTVRLPSAHPPDAATLRAVLALLPVSEIQVLHWACRQADHEVAYLNRAVQGRDYDRTNAFLVSPLWCRRMLQTLSGTLLPAYVGHWTFA